VKKERIYLVEPTGPVEDAPNLTDQDGIAKPEEQDIGAIE
jgi:hypothetical protein